jgi:hypothetical protein
MTKKPLYRIEPVERFFYFFALMVEGRMREGWVIPALYSTR